MRFVIPGKPHGKARPRVGKWGVYNPDSNVQYEKLVRDTYRLSAGGLQPLEDPIELTAVFYFPIPKSAKKSLKKDMADGVVLPTVKSDLDNCLKSIMDGLNGVAYADDKQVVRIEATKKYDFEPRVEVEIRSVYDSGN